MRKAISVVSTLLFLLGLTVKVGAVESTWEFSVQVSASVQETPALITLTWPQDTYMAPNSYTIYRKAPGATSWGTGTTLPGTSTSYTDSNVSVGTAYEYQVVKSTSLYTGYGYLYGGIKVAANENRGKLLLVIDKTYAAQLTSELGRLQQDLTGDGWTVTRLDVNRNDSPATIKDLIKAQYNADPQNVKSVFLFGHVPVPYSGNMVPDGHAPEHYGAWPCDAFYGDMDGTWTDNAVNNTGGSDPRTRNVPGDGKLDQSVLPSALELMVGRVDLANMPGRTSWGGPATFPNELELLRNYLSKDHKFRHKEMDLPRRAIVGDFFGTRDGEAFAASGWRNFAPFFGASNVSFTPDKGTWISQLAANSYLWAYGCGAGTYTSMGGLGTSGSYNDVTTTEIYQNNIKAAFTLFFGSWLGDWDSEDNIMRSVLALPTYGLVSAWSGRPHWFLHHMALGEPIGFGARLTQNNGANGLYRNQINSVAGHAHAALMGDPTLRMHPVGPATSATASSVIGGVQVSWTAAKDSVLGYYVYRAATANGPFTRLTSTPVTGTSWLDKSASGTRSYMVRAIKLETSASGTYYNLSQGAFTTGTGSVTNQPGNSNTNTGSGTTNTPSSNDPSTNAGTQVAWIDDAIPAGAQAGADGGDGWVWTSSNPAPISGSKVHPSTIASGLHQHYFVGASATLPVASGEKLFAYVYIDPANPPRQIMLQWNDGNWDHRAYWGENVISYGVYGTAGRRYMGPIPAAGQWVRLEVPASQVGLEGRSLNGMAFSTYDGRAIWDLAGKTSITVTNLPVQNPVTNTPPVLTNSVVWMEDGLPAGASPGSEGGDTWNWVSSSPTAVSGSKAVKSSAAGGLHQIYFSGATTGLTVASGETLFAYVYLDPANMPSQVMLQWNDGSWDHRAYWGGNYIGYGTKDTPGRRYMGPLPASGKWVRLEVPASLVDLEGRTINGMALSLYNGQASWDCAGKTTLAAPPSGGGSTNTPVPTPTNSVSVWVDDNIPSGAKSGADGGDSWSWVQGSPAPLAGTRSHQSSAGSGLHQHYFYDATQKLTVNQGESLFAYAYLDPSNPPSQIMLQWNDGSWDHRAYWGANRIQYGTDNSESKRYMGPLPATGKWVLLQVPASQLGLEGKTLNGMAFSQYDGRVAWDYAGKASGLLTNTPPVTTNSPPAATNNPPVVTNQPPVSTNLIPSTNVLDVSAIDYITPELPKIGDNTLHVLSPNLLELKLINTKQPDPARVTAWDLVDANGQLQTPAASSFEVTADGKPIGVASVGFKRRPIYASLAGYDLRIENSLYLQLASPISDNQVIEVKNPGGTLWNSSMKFTAKSDPLRYSPAIHVNQEGYMPNHVKKAMVGYYSGSMGEMSIPAGTGFKLVDAATGVQVFQGTLTQRLDSGYTYSPTPYQKVYEANFTSFNTPGEYRLVVPGLGGSLPFLINEGIAMAFARTYALGLFHQRCGADLGLPHTRFSHDKCHTAQASVPSNAEQFAFTWTAIAENARVINNNNPPQIAPALTSPSAQLFPYVNQGTVNVAGGHHDAGDYSKYTANSASLVHYLLFAVDSLPGVAGLDNLGIAESGDGISDVLQEAKWESDFLARMQDADGGFYFLVYPRERKYEIDVTPDKGDAQVVWPKTMSATAASVAALAQCASSPAFKKAYPTEAAQCLQKARLGWQFLLNAINKYGKTGAYQKITHYGDDFADKDELAWAAVEMFLATGDASIHQTLRNWFDPADPATTRWGWWHMAQCYGHAIRSYAFAARSGRVAASQLDASYLAKCETEIKKAGDDVVNWAAINAYGSSFPDATKRVLSAGWYFSTDQAFDLAVAYQINPQASYIDAIVSNMNFEGGVNPVNVTFITGLGWKRQRDVVNQWALNDTRVLPPSGQPIGNITGTFGYLWNYGSMLQALNFPSDSATTAPYPFYDRWGDSWNVNAEFVVINQARSLAALGFLAGRTALKSQTWKAPAATLSVPTKTVEVGQPVTITMQVPGLDTSEARITWEARDQEPAYGHSFVYAPKNNGQQWVEAEAQWPDGRRAFARATFNANAADIVWVDDVLPAGAASGADGGDSWNWVTIDPAPKKGTSAHQSVMAAGPHQHYFDGAAATLSIGTGDVLYAWVYLDPADPPKQIMLQWNDGSWDHRAYWGADLLGYGVSGTPGRRSMGPLPSAGTWVQLKVPASQVNLEGKTIRGMAFTAYDGKVTWDAAGRLSTDTGNVASTVRVAVPATSVSRLEPKAAEFQVIRTGDTNSSLSVTYTLAGSAQAGTDYDCGNVSGPVVIPPGQTVATIPITPKNSSSPTGTDSIVLALASGSDYLVGNPASATLMLEGNTVPVKALAITGGRATLSWTSVSNRTYRVAYKDDLNAPEWKNVANSIIAQSSLSTWTDDGAGQTPSRYYMVAQVN
jgi:hypothetical protein